MKFFVSEDESNDLMSFSNISSNKSFSSSKLVSIFSCVVFIVKGDNFNSITYNSIDSGLYYISSNMSNRLNSKIAIKLTGRTLEQVESHSQCIFNAKKIFKKIPMSL